MIDRRQHPRLNKHIFVTHRILEQALRAGSRIKNISEGGIRMPIIRKLEPGTTVHLEIRLADFQKPITVTGEVIWIKTRNDVEFPFDAGMKFTHVSSSDRKKIRDALCREIRAEIEWIE